MVHGVAGRREHDACVVARVEAGDLLARAAFTKGVCKCESNPDCQCQHCSTGHDEASPAARLLGGEARLARTDLAQHRRSANGVAVEESRVVGIVDIADVVFSFEVLERTQKKAPLFFQLSNPFEVGPASQRRDRLFGLKAVADLVRFCLAVIHRSHSSQSFIAIAERSRNEVTIGICWVDIGIGLQLPPPEGDRQPSDTEHEGNGRQDPDQCVESGRLGDKQHISAVGVLEPCDDLVVSCFGRPDEIGDLVANRPGGSVARLEDALTVTDRTRDASSNRINSFFLGLGPSAAGRPDGEHRRDDDQ